MSQELTIIPKEFATAIARISDGIDGSASLAEKFAPHYIAFHLAASDAAAIGVGQPAAARIMRLRLRAIRVASERTRKETKEEALRRGRAIDGYHAILEDALVPVEKALDDIEKAEARLEAERKAVLVATRREQLLPYCDPTHYALGEMPEPQFVQLLVGAKAAKAAADEAVAQAERDRVAAAAAAECRRLANIAERQRLAAAVAEAERVAVVERAVAAAERQRLVAEQAEKDRLAKVERDRMQAEVARLARAEADRVAAAAAQAAAAAAERQRAERAPDKDKLEQIARMIETLDLPEMTSEAGKKLLVQIATELRTVCFRIRAAAGKM